LRECATRLPFQWQCFVFLAAAYAQLGQFGEAKTAMAKAHLKLGRKLNGEIARLRAAQDAIDIGGGTTKGVSSALVFPRLLLFSESRKSPCIMGYSR